MDTNELNAEMARSGITKPMLAQKMGISKKRLYSRFKGESSFKQDEIASISKILHLSPTRILEIFFTELVS